MTYPPADLTAIQHYLHAQTNQPWDALGIIHGTPQGGGYHEGNDLLAEASRLNSDYSKRESARDRPGTDAASALDLGGDFGRFREITLAIVAACQRGDPRTRDVRECIYTPDGRTVHRWDRLGVRTSGDDSHLTHTHVSFHRDSEGRRDRPDNFLGLLTELFGGTMTGLDDTHRGTDGELRTYAQMIGDLHDDLILGGAGPTWRRKGSLADTARTILAQATANGTALTELKTHQAAAPVLTEEQLDVMAAQATTALGAGLAELASAVAEIRATLDRLVGAERAGAQAEAAALAPPAA